MPGKYTHLRDTLKIFDPSHKVISSNLPLKVETSLPIAEIQSWTSTKTVVEEQPLVSAGSTTLQGFNYGGQVAGKPSISNVPNVINPVSISKPKLTAFEIVKRCAIFPDNAPISVILAGGTIRSLALDVRSKSGDLMLYQFPTILTLGQLRAKLLSSSMSPSLNTGNMEILLSDPMSVNPPAPVVNTSADPYTYEIMLHV